MSQTFTARTAKDFIISRIAEEAQRQGVPLSGVERKMLFWSETDSSGDEALQINDEFEREYDREEYEAKIAKLSKDAYERNKKESTGLASQWSDAIRVLRKGDHYLLVMVDQKVGGPGTSRAGLRDVLAVVVILAMLGGLIWLINWAREEFRPSYPEQLVIFGSLFLLFWLGPKTKVFDKLMDSLTKLFADEKSNTE